MNLPKTIFFLFFLLLVTFYLSLTTITHAQNPIPPGDISCDEVGDPEFHSLRPYQANPCNKEVSETALFCGNSLIISDTVSRLDPGASCQTLPDGKLKCTVDKSKQIAINLSDAELPIMGNTEDVRNSQQSGGFDSAEKVNEYVSWYLNGVTGRAEDGPDNINDTVNFSGPIKKLLPQSIQYEHQIETIEKALARDVNDDGKSQERNRHNQIVVCAKEKWIDFLGIGKTVPIECYEGDGSEAQGDVYRLVGLPPQLSWQGNRLDFARIQDYLVNFGTILLPGIPKETIRNYLGNVWLKKVPPLESQFEDPVFYRKAYNEWRGKTCFLIPVVKFLVCGDNPAVSNKWADLFPYVPLSSTEDRVGLVDLGSYAVQPASEGVEITNVTIENWEPAELYFAHMEEGAELAALLQDTFVPQGVAKRGGTAGVSPQGYCDLVNIRTNEGDDLFAGEVGATVRYTAEFTCEPENIESPEAPNCNLFVGQCVTDEWDCDYGYGQMDCPQGYECKINCTPPSAECKKNVSVNLSVLTKTPKADEVWERTVAGPSAIFKRIFPKVGPGGAILGILDIPAATKVTYTGAGFVGNPDNQRSGEGAELYFPHIGGISEYFLKGIQTILRPKGYGEQILSGAPGTIGGGEINCDKNAPDLGAVSGLLSKSTLVAEFSGEFPGNNIEECYNDVVNRARKAGYDPAFVMAIWIEESGASDYEQFPVVYDFGCMGSTPNNDFNAQISCFLNLKNFYLSPIFDSCKSSTSGPILMEDFLLIFSEGFRACDPNDTTCYRNYCTNPQFPQRIKDFYSRVSGGKSLPPYP